MSSSVRTPARPVASKETAEDYGASSHTIESPHQAFTSTSVHSSQTPNQQLPHPSPARETEQQYCCRKANQDHVRQTT